MQLEAGDGLVPRSRWQHRLQICKVNRLATDTAVVDQLRQLNCHVQMEECMDECTRCERLAFALVDGRIRTAVSARDFVDLISRANPQGNPEGDAGRNRASEPGKR